MIDSFLVNPIGVTAFDFDAMWVGIPCLDRALINLFSWRLGTHIGQAYWMLRREISFWSLQRRISHDFLVVAGQLSCRDVQRWWQRGFNFRLDHLLLLFKRSLLLFCLLVLLDRLHLLLVN